MSVWPYNTAQWQGLRSAKLSNQPLCEGCLQLEIVTPAYAVDHIVAIAAGGDPFPPFDGLMSLCEGCHNHKTNAKDHPNAHGFRRALRGYDVDGSPIDPEGWESATEGHTAPSDADRHMTKHESESPSVRLSDDSTAIPDEAGGLEGRETHAKGPAWDTCVDLVLRTDRNKDDELWV